MDTGNFQANLMGPSTTMYTAPPKASAEDMSSPSAALARYHSAPSSTFAALLEQDFYPATDGAELVQFLAHSGLGEYAAAYVDAGLSMKPNQEQARCIKLENAHAQQSYLNQKDRAVRHSGRMGASFQEHIGQVPLSAILEHSGEETLVSQPEEHSPRENTPQKPLLASSVHFKSNLIRHSSLPTDFLSRLAMEDMSENPAAPQHVGAHVQTTSPRPTNDSTGGKVYVLSSNLSPRGVPVRKCVPDAVDSCKADEYRILEEDLKQCALVRQSSSPAGLLSQLTLDDFSPGADKVAMSSAAQGLVQGHAVGAWDEAAMDSAMQKMAAFGQRKRGRDADARLFKGLPAVDVLMGSLEQGSCPPANHYVGTANGDTIPADSVLCRSRAKRGCATHPRSIAERVRRMKISERMKKLQDLVPNLDKQAHTADMLDEVVEYVKLLQRKVQELSTPNECNGMCRKRGANAHEM